MIKNNGVSLNFAIDGLCITQFFGCCYSFSLWKKYQCEWQLQYVVFTYRCVSVTEVLLFKITCTDRQVEFPLCTSMNFIAMFTTL